MGEPSDGGRLNGPRLRQWLCVADKVSAGGLQRERPPTVADRRGVLLVVTCCMSLDD